jgi:flavorubredoxin
MPITNRASGTTLDEIASGIYRISTPLPPSVVPGGFSFNQYLIIDEKPMLFHTGPKSIFPLVKEAITRVTPIECLRYIGFSHYEQDECGSLNLLLAAAPEARPVCSKVNLLINGDGMDRPAAALAHGEMLSLGKRAIRWYDTPHLPHAWECGYILEDTTKILFCGDLFTQGGHNTPPITESDILGPSEAFRKTMDYFSHTKNVRQILEPLALSQPAILACMHGSAWKGDGQELLLALAESLS